MQPLHKGLEEHQQRRKSPGPNPDLQEGQRPDQKSAAPPAFNMIRYEQTPFLGLYTRTLEKHGQKMKSYVAVQKKLLVVIYTLWKQNKPYQLHLAPPVTDGVKLPENFQGK